MIQRTIKEKILDLYAEKRTTGELLTDQQLDGYYRLFRQKFGPEALAGLDGEALLMYMHDISNRDSLVYWMEFKNDSEFPAKFGSIAGGTALKFGVYKRRETGVWMIGSPQKQEEISVDKAIEIARQHREQLTRGVSLIQKLPDLASDEAYIKLQQDLSREAGDVQNSSWGHKYFHMLCPDKLDNYHAASFQRFYLIKLLQLPPAVEGRYVCAGRFIALARHLQMSVNSLTSLLNRINGQPYSYWRIRIPGGASGIELLQEMMQENVVSMPVERLDDLSWLAYNQKSKTELRVKIDQAYQGQPKPDTGPIFNFATAMQENDLVLAWDGERVHGVGKVVDGGYHYRANSRIPHRRPVRWLSAKQWDLPVLETPNNPMYLIRQHRNMIAAEEQILEKSAVIIPPSGKPHHSVPAIPHLDGIPGRIQNVLDRKRQVILYGPPGTGKTCWAMRTANDLAAYAVWGRAYKDLQEDERQSITGKNGQANGMVRKCTFHPAYGYEDFIEGYRPVSANGQLAFERRAGIFKQLCEDAAKDPAHAYYLVIDEINRGDIPRIFGELITLLEKDKRGQPLLLPLSGSQFQVPDNVYVIGTMNTADRSIALLDTALRRRFGFVELMPETNLLNIAIDKLPLGPWLQVLNERIRQYIGRDARNLQIGHAYFLDGEKPVSDKARFVRILRDDILPLLEEYCYGDYDTLGSILGDRLVDLKNQRLNEDLLSLDFWDQLVEALLALKPDLITSSLVTNAQQDGINDIDLDNTGQDDEPDGESK